MTRVRPEARRLGIGTALVEAAREEAQRTGRAGMVGRVVDPEGYLERLGSITVEREL